MSSIDITDNSKSIKDAADEAIQNALRRISGKMEKYAKARRVVGTPESTGKPGYIGGTLRNSIKGSVDGNTAVVGTNVHYAPYVELGTGPNYTPPPDWIEFNAERGKGVGKGYVTARPFIRPAVADHLHEYKGIIERTLKDT